MDQNIFSDPKFGTPKKLGTNFLDPNEIFRPIDILYPQKFLDLRKFWMQKLDNVKFGSNKDFGPRKDIYFEKKFLSQKNWASKFLDPKNFLAFKNFGPKISLWAKNSFLNRKKNWLQFFSDSKITSDPKFIPKEYFVLKNVFVFDWKSIQNQKFWHLQYFEPTLFFTSKFA